MRDITPLIAPRSIAVIGASANPTKSGGVLFANLAKGKFRGPLYPINRTAPEVMGLKAYASLAEVPQQVDLVYIVLPQQHVEDAVKQCVAAKARAACIITAGYSEAGAKGRTDEERLRTIAHSSGLLLAGPNTIGLVNAEIGMMGSFVNFPHWETGGISFFTQTGIFTGALMLDVMTSPRQRLPVGKSIDVGNKIDVDELDFLNYAADDPATKVIGFYIESIRKPRLFFEKARQVRKDKPIVLLKPGRTRDGAKASASHTGSLAANDEILNGALTQFGIPRAEDEEDFLNALRALAMLPKPRGRRIGIATTSGALGVIATDLVVEAGLELATFAPSTIAEMRKILPDWLDPANPFDFWISIDIKGPREAHEVGLTAVFADPNVDLVLCTLLAPGNADFPEFGDLLRRLRRQYPKPIALVIYGGDAAGRWRSDVEGADIPVFRTTRAAARALSLLVQATLEPGSSAECHGAMSESAVKA
jgi:acetate---CoA ligase (ADP-forming)